MRSNITSRYRETAILIVIILTIMLLTTIFS